ncbi:glycosyltransferase family 87 protein [Acidisphaera sp. L21]|uniref:glycosyltransferase family 87 protein n=1 Tax=Acidisphaera sp. L21 TaxID=1641851 RepID=UPI00131B9610|nr:glycosyltransferase family 87 protein [Acidisphaera sp. L21]
MNSARRERYLVGAGLILLLLVGAELLCHRPGAVSTIGSDERLRYFIGLECLAGAVYFGAVWLVRSGPLPARTAWLVLGLGFGMRVLPLVWPPFLSSDLFRYVWDGRVQAQGINPYRYLPAAPQLEFLRDNEIYASVNRSEEAPTIYPPVAQIIFAAIGQIWSSITMVKIVMAGFEAVTIVTIAILLRRAALPMAGVLVYAWNPLPLWEYAGNGHIDAASIAFIALAMLLASTARQGWAGLLLGAAILCKLLPAAVFPAFWRRWDWRMLATTLGVIVLLYAAYAVGAGWHVLGYLPGYAAEEGLDSGSGFFLLRAARQFVPLPAWTARAYLAVAAIALLGLAAYYMLGRPHPTTPGGRIIGIGRAGAVLATATTIALSPHYPWYLGWLALFACFAPYRSVIYLSVSGVILYVDPYHREAIYPWLIYGPALVLAAFDVAQAHRARTAPSMESR